MAFGTILSVAQTLFAALQCQELREMCSSLCFESQLHGLETTVTTVKAVLLEAEAKGELNHQAQLYVEELKDAVYDADDLFDEFVTLAERKHKKLKACDKSSKKVHRFLYSFKKLTVAYRMSQGVKEIKKNLGAIADNHNKYGFKLGTQPIRKRSEETCSYVYEPDIIGRDVEKEEIVGMLLDSNVKQDVSFLTIVGMGGLGKTTLTQLVYNDGRIKNVFPVRLWACVADEDPNHLNVKAVLGKILGENTDQEHYESIMNQVQQKLVGQFLLVLDDVWNENRYEWLELEKIFRGHRGSWVIVTTRSNKTAETIEGSTYDLKSLSDEDSCRLFEKVAFGQNVQPDLIEIGQKIVKKCVNVPLAIKVVGSLLYGQDKEKWLLLQNSGLVEVKGGQNNLLPILMLSYHHLESQLKSCFSYCALFPKDTILFKEDLIHQWMAQGYIVPFDQDQSIEEAGEEYFSILLRRCFFQDVERDEDGEVNKCKIHDLMHELAQQVAGKEILVNDDVDTSSLDKKIRHLSTNRSVLMDESLKKTKVRTLCISPFKYILNFDRTIQHLSTNRSVLMDASLEKTKVRTWCISPSKHIPNSPTCPLLENWICLRALNLSFSWFEHLPESIGKLLHLRYLNLSGNYAFKRLPRSIAKLHNLQTLNLRDCGNLGALPDDFGNLVKLRFLETRGCRRLTHMPSSMAMLSCLHTLTMFPVNVTNPGYVDALNVLKGLTELKGRLRIQICNPNNATYVKEQGSEGGCLMNKQHLKNIVFMFEGKQWGEVVNSYQEALMEDMQLPRNLISYQEALMEDMQLPRNLISFELYHYHGARMPSWGREDKLATCLPNLVTIYLRDCDALQCLAHLGKLRHLRSLTLDNLKNLEYIENRSSSEVGVEASGLSEGDGEFSLFPSLELLDLTCLPKMEGWWREVEVENDSSNSHRLSGVLPSFPHLSELSIAYCPKLTSIPLCPSLVELFLDDINERLRIMEMNFGSSKLRRVRTTSTRVLRSGMPMEAFQHLTELEINCDKELRGLEEVGEVLWSCSSSLQSLEIGGCEELRSVRGGLEHLTALESLLIANAPNLSLTMCEDGGTVLWGALQHSLRSLTLCDLPKLVHMPEGMQLLTSLQFLEIAGCKALESLPEWMLGLTSLTRLVVGGCSEELFQRCQPRSGSDWPNIQHIPDVKIIK